MTIEELKKENEALKVENSKLKTALHFIDTENEALKKKVLKFHTEMEKAAAKLTETATKLLNE